MIMTHRQWILPLPGKTNRKKSPSCSAPLSAVASSPSPPTNPTSAADPPIGCVVYIGRGEDTIST